MVKLIERKAINTTKDGLCRTIVSWYQKGGRSNFTNWNGENHFAMTGVLEIYEIDEEDGKDKTKTNKEDDM